MVEEPSAGSTPRPAATPRAGASGEPRPMSPSEVRAALADRDRQNAETVRQPATGEQGSVPRAPQLKGPSSSGAKLPAPRRTSSSGPSASAVPDFRARPDRGSDDEDGPPKPGLLKRRWVHFLIAFLMGFGLSFSTQQVFGSLVGYDGFYHVRAGTLYMNGELPLVNPSLAEHGVPVPEARTPEGFPWTQRSTWRDHYADKDFLWHVWVGVFTLVTPADAEGLILAGQLSCAFTCGLIALAFLICLRSRKVRWSLLWVLLMLTVNETIVYRFAMCRSYMFSSLFLLLGWYLLSTRRWWWLLPLATVYTLGYTAPHLLLIMTMLWAFLEIFLPEPSRRVMWKKLIGAGFPLVFCSAGMVIGVILHPHSLHLMESWFAQNVAVPLFNLGYTELVVSMADHLHLPYSFDANVKVTDLGRELNAVSGRDLLAAHGGLLLMLILPWLIASAARYRIDRVDLFLWLNAIAFFCLFLTSQRFAEYAVPFVTLAAATLATRSLAMSWVGRYRLAHPVRYMIAVGVVVAAILGNGAGRTISLYQTLTLEVKDTRPDKREVVRRNMLSREFEPIAAAMKEKLPKGAVVYHAAWDSFPQLFFYGEEFRYMVGLDPTFMYLSSPKLYQLYFNMKGDGGETDPRPIHEVLSTDFGAQYALVRPDNDGFLTRALQDAALKYPTRVEKIAHGAHAWDPDDPLKDGWRLYALHPEVVEVQETPASE